jgi:hypothetical protein
MAGQQAGNGSRPSAMSEATHDLRGAIAAATAFLDLARERLAEGEAVSDDELAKVERSLLRAHEAVVRLDALIKEAAK